MEGKRIKVPDEETDEVCELCGRKMVIKSGRYGKFLACPGFPECKNTKRLVKDTGGLCPKCGSRMLVRHSKRAVCTTAARKPHLRLYATWNEPTTEKMPECGSTLFKKGGKNGILLCEKEGCGYSRALGAEKRSKSMHIRVLGAGLAGCEAALYPGPRLRRGTVGAKAA